MATRSASRSSSSSRSRSTSRRSAPRRTTSSAGRRSGGSSTTGRSSGAGSTGRSKSNSSTSTAGTSSKKSGTSSTGDSKSGKNSKKVSENDFVNAIHDTHLEEGKDKAKSSFEASRELKSEKGGEKDRSQELADNLLSGWDMEKAGQGPQSSGQSQGASEVRGSAEARSASNQGSEEAQGTQAPSRDQLSLQSQENFQKFAKENPEALQGVLEQAYPNATEAQRSELADQMAKGTAPMPENLQFVEPGDLNGAQGAYSAENGGTVSLSKELVGQPEALNKVFTEEVGHHFDSSFGNGDSQGDEGQIFQEGVANNGPLAEERLAALKSENDHGVLTKDGRSTAVENSAGRHLDLGRLPAGDEAPGLGRPGGQAPQGAPGQPAFSGDAKGGVDPTTGASNVSAPSNTPGGQIGDPNRVTGAAARVAQDPNIAPFAQDMLNPNPDVRQKAAQQMSEQLNQLDPASRDQMISDLSRIAGVPEETMATQLGRGQAQNYRMAAMESLQAYGTDNLSVEQLDTLAGALSDTELPGEAASRMFGQMAADPVRSQNNQYATDTLRNLTQVEDNFNTAGRAADALSMAEGQDHFQAGDYQSLLDGGMSHQFGAGQKALKTLGEAAGSDPSTDRQSQAMDTLRANLGDRPADGKRHEAAAEAMGMAVNNMEAQDSRLLGSVATNSTEGATRSALDTLEKAALREDGGAVDGAASAIGQTLHSTAFRGGDKHEMASQTARDTFDSGSDEVRSDIANNIFRADRLSEEQSGQALDILRARTGENAGDEKAIRSLGQALNNDDISRGNRSVAADTLGDTAGAGSDSARDLLVGALNSGSGNSLDGGHYSSEQSDEALNWLGAEGLGRAAKAGDAGSLQALRDGYTQGVERGEAGEFTADAAMNQLGQLGSELGKDSSQGEGVRDFVRDALDKGDGRAAYAMEDMAHNLGDADVDSLLGQLDDPAGDDIRLSGGVDSALNAVVNEQPEEHGRQVLDHVRGRLEDDPLRSMSAMGELAGHLNPQDVQSIAAQTEGDFPDQAINTLAEINASSDNNAVKMEAAKTLAEPDNFGQLSENQRRDLVNTVALNGTQEMKSQLRDQLGVNAPMSADALAEIGNEFTDQVASNIERAMGTDPGNRTLAQHDLVELAELSHAQAIANDPENENAGRIDKEKLEQKLDDVRERLGQEFDKITESIREKHAGIGAEQGDFLQSQDFRDVLKLTPADQRADVVKAELSKLQAIDPARADRVAEQLGDQLRLMQAQETPNSLRLFQGESLETQAATIDGINQALFGEGESQEGGSGVKDAVGTAGTTNQLASRTQGALKAKDATRIAKLMQKVDPDKVQDAAQLSKAFKSNWSDMAGELSDTIRRLEESGDSESLAKAKEALGSLNRVKDWMSKVDEVGGWGSMAAGLGITSMALGDMPRNLEETARAGTSLMSIGGNLDDVGTLASKGTRAVASKVFGAGSKVDDLAKLPAMQGVSKGLKAMKWLGPVSDIGSGVLDGIGSYNEYQKGDIHGSIGKGISATGSLAAGAAGLAILAGASGPAAPIVLVGGTVVGVGGMVYESTLGMDAEQEFLNRLGIYDHWK